MIGRVAALRVGAFIACAMLVGCVGVAPIDVPSSPAPLLPGASASTEPTASEPPSAESAPATSELPGSIPPPSPTSGPTPTAAVTAAPTPRITAKPAKTPKPTCVDVCSATAAPAPTVGPWSIAVTTDPTFPLGATFVDYHVHITGSIPQCSLCDPYPISCSVYVSWPSAALPQKITLSLVDGVGTANQTFRQTFGMGEAGTWHWDVTCGTGDANHRSERSDSGTFDVVP